MPCIKHIKNGERTWRFTTLIRNMKKTALFLTALVVLTALTSVFVSAARGPYTERIIHGYDEDSYVGYGDRNGNGRSFDSGNNNSRVGGDGTAHDTDDSTNDGVNTTDGGILDGDVTDDVRDTTDDKKDTDKPASDKVTDKDEMLEDDMMTDGGGRSTVGVVIAILIAVAVIVLIVALVPKGRG